MAQLSGKLSEEAAASVVARIFRERRTGVLSLRDGGKDERWSFVSGELYLPGQHRLVSAFHALSGGDPGTPAAPGGGGSSVGGFSWVELAAAALGRWNEGDYELEDGPGGITADLHGPLPTAALVMHASVHGRNEFELSRMLGGDDSLFVGTEDGEGLGTELDPHEAFFLSRLEQPVAVKDLLRQAGLDRQAGLEKLCRLLAVGLIQRHRSGEVPVAEPSIGLLSKKMLANFSQRIESSLAERPPAIERQEHRNKVAGLLGSLGTMNFFELLGVGAGASQDEIHGAYMNLARVVHPRHAPHLELEGKEAGLQLLFERATEAYLTLSDEERSRAYLQEIGGLDTVGAPSAEDRQVELDKLAEQNYKRASALEMRGDYHFAIELVQQAARTSPRPEYLALLGRCQAQNPRWLDKAEDSFLKALELGSDDPDIRVELAKVYEAQDRAAAAREQHERALQAMPGHPGASAGLERLSARSKKTAGAEGADGKPKGWLRRLLNR